MYGFFVGDFIMLWLKKAWPSGFSVGISCSCLFSLLFFTSSSSVFHYFFPSFYLILGLAFLECKLIIVIDCCSLANKKKNIYIFFL